MMIKSNKKKKTSFLLRVVFLGLLIGFSAVAPVDAGEIVVIVNKSNKTASLSLKDLQQIYQGSKKSWDGGESITLYLPPAKSAAMNALATKVFSTDGAAGVSKFYLKAVFQEKFASPPKSSDNAVAEVAGTPGGIAVIDTSEVAGTPGGIAVVDTSSVKVIKVDGL